MDLFSFSQALDARNKELSKLREEFANKSNSVISKHSQELTTEREKALQVRSFKDEPILSNQYICFFRAVQHIVANVL